jgi:tetratricopeptide (TPR) repeat protein
MNADTRRGTFRARALLAALGSFGVMGAQLELACARELDTTCYSDFHCLASAATTSPDQIRPELLGTYISTLARLGLFDRARSVAQRFDRSSVTGRLDWQNANGAIAVQEVAAAAWIAPDKAATFDPIESLSKPETEGFPGFDMPVHCGLVANAIMYRSHWTLIDSGLASIFRPKMVRRSSNATLTDILTSRWPQALQQQPPDKQGSGWNDLAKVWLELGNDSLAQEAVERAEAVGQVDFQGMQRVYDVTWRTWLALGNILRALQAVDHVKERGFAAQFRLDVSRSLIETRRKDEALAVIAATLPDVGLAQNSSQKMGLLGTILDLRLAAGDQSGAHAAAEEIAILAHQRDIAPAGQLALAAAAFNNLGDHATAIGLLREAVAKVPGNRQAIAFGLTLGPITGATLGLADSLRSEIAVEFYRAGDVQAFNELMPQMSSRWQARTWGDLCRSSGPGGWVRPSDQVCVDVAGIGILVDFATYAAKKGDVDAAEQYLLRAVAGENGGHSWPAGSRLTDAARLAVVINKEHLAGIALSAAAEAADNVPDQGARELALADVAALRKELAPQ